MTASEIEYQFKRRVENSLRYLRDGKITAEQHAENVSAARDWKRRAESGYWDHQAWLQERRNGGF